MIVMVIVGGGLRACISEKTLKIGFLEVAFATFVGTILQSGLPVSKTRFL